MIERRPLGERGQCEAWDWIPDGQGDAVFVRCHREGRVIRETGCGIDRHRCVCPLHGLTSAMGDELT